jgi:hypothetical protein
MADDSGQQALMQAMMAGSLYGPNIYSHYPNGIPPTSYRGAVTDAMGNPIRPPPAATPGTTLNQTQSQPQGQISPYNIAKGNPAIDAGNTAAGLMALSSMIPNGQGGYTAGPGTPLNYWGSKQAGGAAAGGAGQQQAAAPADTSYQDALDRLSDPGKVTTPGATVPQAASLGDQVPSVLQSFLASRSGGRGAGNYNNQPFFDTLNALRG